ncbi:MAG: YihY/virulence factor BrkB family protein [Chitinivibrionales bacterium]|nr:YihY/virulence factor BrkB family protein [Chitinivibrionales bacterium]
MSRSNPIKKTAHFFVFSENLIIQTIKNFFADDCLTIASSVSFVFLLSIIPLMSLTLFFTTTIQNFFFPDLIILDTNREMLVNEMVRLIPFISKEWVHSYLLSTDTSFSSFTVINILLLPIASGIVFITLENAYRRIFRLPPRHLIFSQVLYSMITLFIVFVLFILSLFWSFIASPITHLRHAINDALVSNGLNPLFFHITLWSQRISIISIGLIILFYYTTTKLFLPITIRRSARVIAVMAFCLLWVVSRLLFHYYIENISKISIVYGSLSSVVIILLWIFYCSITLLFSIELLFAIHSTTAAPTILDQGDLDKKSFEDLPEKKAKKRKRHGSDIKSPE